MSTSFESLGLARPILEALSREGYETPTPIQAQCIPPAVEGRDIMGCAQTGTGKTAAFALPILHRLHTATLDKSRRGPAKARALVLSPTRELAMQIGDGFGAYGRGTGLRQAVIFGGVKQGDQVRRLRAGLDIITATPGRLMDLMEQGHVDLSAIEIFVLDEADRMLDMGFIHPIRRIAAMLPKPRQTLLFSATMPRNIAQLADSLLTDPVRVAVTPVASAAPLIEQSVYMVERFDKAALLERLLAEDDVKRALVFTRTKHGADKLAYKLGQSGVTALAIHGNRSQSQRQRALEQFRSGRSRVLVATDVAARGIDVDGVTHVFNFNLPNEPEAYVHRIGRTGRAGATGKAISFCDREERGFLRAIERLTGKPLPQNETGPIKREANTQAAPETQERFPVAKRLPQGHGYAPRSEGTPQPRRDGHAQPRRGASSQARPASDGRASAPRSGGKPAGARRGPGGGHGAGGGRGPGGGSGAGRGGNAGGGGGRSRRGSGPSRG
ncbi:MAG: DEAD/DEAH box helicase [Phycisphaerales bacterium]|nr:DEAD/DEAH box helicase [Phycisphaerales bacterium]